MIDVDGGEEGEDGGRGARWRRGWRPRRCKCKDRQTESIDEEDEEDGTSADDQERGVLIEMVMRSRVVLKTMGWRWFDVWMDGWMVRR